MQSVARQETLTEIIQHASLCQELCQSLLCARHPHNTSHLFLKKSYESKHLSFASQHVYTLSFSKQHATVSTRECAPTTFILRPPRELVLQRWVMWSSLSQSAPPTLLPFVIGSGTGARPNQLQGDPGSVCQERWDRGRRAFLWDANLCRRWTTHSLVATTWSLRMSQNWGIKKEEKKLGSWDDLLVMDQNRPKMGTRSLAT